MRSYARTVLPWLSAAILLLSGSPGHAEPMFNGIGILPPGITYDLPFSYPTGLSLDGTVVVGVSVDGSLAPTVFRWTLEGGITSLGTIPDGFTGERATNCLGLSADGSTLLIRSSRGRYYVWKNDGGFTRLETGEGEYRLLFATSLSDDGSTVVGRVRHRMTGEDEAGRWTFEDSWVGLGRFPGGGQSTANDVSADGSIVIGSGVKGFNEREAFVWSAEGGLEGIDKLSGGDFYSSGEQLSADGTAVAGRSNSVLGPEDFVWTAEHGMIGVGQLPGGVQGGSIADLSQDGSIAVGQSQGHSAREAFVWTRDTGMMGIAEGSYRSIARAIAPDGSYVVGENVEDVFDNDTYRAFIWDEEHGRRQLDTLLTDLGIDLEGWVLTDASYISADGTSIAGVGINPASRQREAWVAVVPPIGTNVLIDIKPGVSSADISLKTGRIFPVAILGSEEFDVRDVDRATLSFGAAERFGAAPKHAEGGHLQDVNRDGIEDLLSHYRTEETGIVPGDTDACVTGALWSGAPIEGCDRIHVRNSCEYLETAYKMLLPPVPAEATRVSLVQDNRIVFRRGEFCSLSDGPPYRSCVSADRDDYPDFEFADWDHQLQQSSVSNLFMSGSGAYDYHIDISYTWTNSVFDVVFDLMDRAEVRLVGSAEIDEGLDGNQVVARLVTGESVIYENAATEGPIDFDFEGVLQPGRYQLQVLTDMISGYRGSYDFDFEIAPTVAPPPPSLDIKPDNEVNEIKLMSAQTIAVALLGSDSFDVRDVVIQSVSFGPAGAARVRKSGGDLQDGIEDCYGFGSPRDMRDTNRDGHVDLVSYYRVQDTGIEPGDTEACVTGEETLKGRTFEACDSILVASPVCGLGFEFAFVLPGLMWLRNRRTIH